MTGPSYPIAIEVPCAAVEGEAVVVERVGRVLQDLAAQREVSDEEIRQHARDCNELLERLYGRYLAHGNPHDREEAYLWMNRRDEALRIFSRRGHTFVELGR